MITHTAHITPFPHHYAIKDSLGELIATIAPATKDANIMRVCWFGGDRHGLVDLSEGGLDGAMEFIGGKS